VLNLIGRELNPESSLSQRGNELWQTYCVGEKGWFSDESANDKRYFKNELSFPDPDGTANRLELHMARKSQNRTVPDSL
jgi:hypothetical protein